MDGGEERHAVVYAAQPTAAGVFLRQRGTGHCAWRAGGAAELKRHGNTRSGEAGGELHRDDAASARGVGE